VIYKGDCRKIMKEMATNSVDSIVTDPPYELGFMAKKWDKTGVANDVSMWAECLRVLKPGGHLLAFGGSRTYHRMASAVEDAGFEIRDQIMWIFGSGFPKSLNLDGGLGTALKPAHEPIVMARKPLCGTVEKNVEQYGTGAVNIDDCRVGESAGWNYPNGAGGVYSKKYQEGNNIAKDWNNFSTKEDNKPVSSTKGRWPANVIHDGSQEVLELFPDSKGQQGDVRGTEKSRTGGEGTNCYGEYNRIATPKRGDSGSAARFFYCPKTNKKDRNEGCEDLPIRSAGEMVNRTEGSAGIENPRAGAGRTSGSQNNHPTVKPTELMRYLCRLVTPAGGIILDPFMGSGSTGKAALLEGFQFIGVELEAEYLPIAAARIDHATKGSEQ
jgi:DNA modification methylase